MNQRKHDMNTVSYKSQPGWRSDLAFCFCIAVVLGAAAPRIWQLLGNADAVAASSTGIKDASSSEAATSRLLTKRIEQIRCGDRIQSELPLGLQPEEEPEPDPATWRLVELEVTNDSGDKVEVKLLRPRAWLEKAGAIQQGTFPLRVEELGIDCAAAVLRVMACCPIEPGDGQIVTGTFRHVCDSLVELHLQGTTEPIVCTSGHLVWSEDRKSFVPAARLQFKESVSVLNGTGVVQAVKPSASAEVVYNIEVNRTHTYLVGSSGTLVHNSTIFRGDDNYGGGDIGSERSFITAIDIIDHVTQRATNSPLVSFSTKASAETANSRGAAFFGKVLKVNINDIDGDIITPDDAYDIIKRHPKKKIWKQAKDIRAHMKRNNEVLVNGTILQSCVNKAN